MAVAPSWTGFYIFGGGGGGIWAADSTLRPPWLVSRSRSISGTAVPAGSARSVPAMTGSSTELGRRRSRRRSVRQHEGTIHDTAVALPDAKSFRTPGRLARGWAIWSLRMCSPTSMAATPARIGRVRSYDRIRGASIRSHTLIQPEWLVRRRRRREQPEHLRHHRARLVHEDRIPRRLTTIASTSLRPIFGQTVCRLTSTSLQAFVETDQHLAGLSLQLDRPGGREILISSLRS